MINVSGFLIAGTAGGVFLTGSSANSWVERNQGFIPIPQVLSFLSANNYLFAGTQSNYVWKRLITNIIGIKIISSEVPEQFVLHQNFPNPFNPATKIRFDVPKAENVSIKIYDMLGKEIETLVNQNLQPGIYETDWDATKVSSGIYYYRIITEKYTETRKMVLIK